MTNDRTAVHCCTYHRARGYRGFRVRLHFSSATLSLTSVRKEVVDTRSTKHFLCTLLDAILNSHLASFKTWHSVSFHRSSLLFIIITVRKGALYQIGTLHTNMVRKKRLDAIEFDREEKVRVLFFLTLSMATTSVKRADEGSKKSLFVRAHPARNNRERPSQILCGQSAAACANSYARRDEIET